jgi:hypothetical protein
MGKYTRAANIIAGADTASGANRARALGGASRRATEMGDVLFDVAAPVLMQPDVLASLPADLAARIKLGDADAVMEGYLEVMSSGRVPQNIPRDTQIARNNFPDASAGFQVGAYGGGVPYDSAGDLVVAGSRSLSRNPGAEAGFTVDGIGPQQFDPTGLAVQNRAIQIRTPQRQAPRGTNPLATGLAAAAAGAGGYYAGQQIGGPAVDVFADMLGDPVDVVPEARDEGAPKVRAATRKQKPAIGFMSASSAVDQALSAGGQQASASNTPQFEYGDSDPMRTTYYSLLDAGIDPARAEGIARGRMSMTQIERDAVIRNSEPRRQRQRDEIERRRNERMGGY